MRASMLSFATIALLAAGCGGSEGTPELQRFESCDELNAWIQVSARKQVNFVGPWGGGVLRGGGDVALEGGAPPQANGDDGAGSYTTTNVQIDGVDEADFVKNDGEHVFVLDTAGLSILDAWPAEDLAQIARVAIEGQPDSLFFDGAETAVVFSRLWGEDPAPESGEAMVDARESWDPMTKVTVLDVADRADPQVLRELYLDGNLRTTRRVGDRVHLVLTDGLTDVYEADASSDGSKPSRLEAIAAAEATDWLPRKADHRIADDGWDVEQGSACGCTDVYRPVTRTDLVFATVATIDLTDPTGAVATAGVLSRADTVFATAESLYLAMAEWDHGPFRSFDGSLDSRLHKFALTDDGPVYTASGRVDGTLLDQFSMDEHEERLRVATTDNNAREVSAGVYVLEQQDTRLTTVGSVTGLAPGESIFAARFQGDRGFVVTFEQIDPLFTIDLSDPTAPVAVGELEVTGFSNYLHPLPGDRLLAVGEEITADGMTWLGLQVSLFDVSDFADPTLEDRQLIPGQGWSEAQYDHHAFTWYPEHDVLSLPVQRWSNGAERPDNALAVFEVLPGEADAITEVGEVDHSAFLAQHLDAGEDWDWCGQVRRSIWLEDRLLTVSDFGVQVVALDDLDTTIAGWVAPDGGCSGWWGW